MRYPYDPTQSDPLGIRAAVERERLKSRFRDRCSRERIHPIANDFGRLFDFVMSRRRRQPGALDLLRRSLNRTDVAAILSLVEMVLTKGACNRAMRRRCARLIWYCEQLVMVFVLKGALND
jgi:hypothetical protein